MEESDSTKYVIHAQMKANGVVERPDVVGAIFGQTEGLVGKDLDLRDLQKSGRVGRINVKVKSKGGRSKGTVHIPTSLGKLEASILAASLETIERIGPCKAKIEVTNIEDVRSSKREQITNRAQELLDEHFEGSVQPSDITAVMEGSPKKQVKKYHGLTAGPNVHNSDAILVVEGRSDVLNLLQYGIKNAVAIGGTDMPGQMKKISDKKTVTAFLDGDRGGELILKELMQRASLDYVARAPDGNQVEHLDKDEIMKSLRDKVDAEKALQKKPEEKPETEEKKEKEEKEGEEKKESEEKEKPSKKTKKTKGKKKVKRIQSKPKKSLKSTFLKNAKKRISQQIESSEEEGEGKQEEDEQPEEEQRPSQGEKKQKKVKREKEPEPDEEAPPKAEADLKHHFDEVKDSRKARLIDDDGEVLKEIEVGDLMNSLREVENGVSSAVLDGIITQRLLDMASDRGVKDLVGAEMGEVVHRPADLEIKVIS